jgi:phosphate transport system protein
VDRAIDLQMESLKQMILLMGGYVESALSEVTIGLLQKQEQRFELVHELESKINKEHVSIDEYCVNMLAKNAPVAKDLRMVVSILKINTDLERMGDQTVNIAYTGRDYLKRAPLAQAQKISRMSELVRVMVRGSLDSFVRADAEAAKKILLMDDEVDELKNEMFQILSAHMKHNPQDVESSLDLILVARNLERLGDHATNIAEDVIFAQTGKDIRHGGGG